MTFSCVESVPEASDAHDVSRFYRIRFDFSAQLDDVRVDHPVGYEHVSAPDLIDDLSSVHDTASSAKEELHHLELDRRQIDASARTDDP